MLVAPDSPDRADVRALLTEHLAQMHATSPPDSVHALGPVALATPGTTFLTARSPDGALLGCGALVELAAAGPGAPGHGELKSMRTAGTARRRGVASAVLVRLLAVARERRYGRVSLETGSQELFAAARRLYARHGFEPCGPFGTYVADPHSVFLSLELAADDAVKGLAQDPVQDPAPSPRACC
ncbi:GNAT family N-acetyltransferase [Isoptericola sp. NEAU-Y5]|uniref:GNAT family N-acetyltransferase n=1 Tax=Isoptericola luteus TaxID=2879484 RepID=A0ABS7ZI81_9MICO|nr:GNAT family N-acetyltransferase [Isoptericola sp. NEAU-Y5]MCA5894736.1 GNAT family N-acetyltransferase [Isoptericola sp. NEAU-Y5]